MAGFDVKGMSIQDIRGVNTRSLSTGELRQALTRMVSAANKRLNRMMKDPVGRNAPDVSRMKGAKFSSKGLNTRAEVKAEFDRLRNFLDPTKQSHSLGGWKKTVKQLAAEQGLTEDQYTDPEFWRAYRKFQKDNPNLESHRALGMVGQIWDDDEEIEDFEEASYELEQAEIDNPEDVVLMLLDNDIPMDSIQELVQNPDFIEDLESGRLYEIMNNREVMEDLRDGIYEKERFDDIEGEFEGYI